MDENKKKLRKLTAPLLMAELGAVFLGAAGVSIVLWMRREPLESALQKILFTVMGLAAAGFLFRREYIRDRLDYDNAEHPFRFWASLAVCIAAACVCGFLPAGGWPFPVIYLILSLFGSTNVGILSASVLLMVSVFAGGADVIVFFLYFISGIFVAALFYCYEGELKIGQPLFLSMLCLLLCETAGIVLTDNNRLNFESFVIPVSNIIISGILMAGCMKVFSSTVFYRYREKYLELNDTGNPMLVQLKDTAREAYFQSVHTAYFCERIARRLSLDADALKCAGYYHKVDKVITDFLEKEKFPPAAEAVLREYMDKKTPIQAKETAVLLCSDAVVAAVTLFLSKNGDKHPDYDKIIDVVFGHLIDSGTFNNCDISLRELKTMQKKFKEEKLYYDFLR